MHTVSISMQQTGKHTHIFLVPVSFFLHEILNRTYTHYRMNKLIQAHIHTHSTFSKCNVAAPHNEIRACGFSLFRFIECSMLHFVLVSLPLSLSLLLLQYFFFWLHLNFATRRAKKKVCTGGSNVHRATIE